MFYLISSIVSCITISLILKLAENHQVHAINFILTYYPVAGILVSCIVLFEKVYPIS